VLLPTLRDPRLHLAGVIVSLQILGQVAFGFRLSIAQILVSLITCAVLEVAITFRQQGVIMWPASALLTGNGVAFILRVPGTVHGDWWSMRGWWIFAGTAAFALLSKYLIRWRGRHVFNPSNIGLVVCFLLLGPARAEPLDFWWGPMSIWLALALALIVVGGFAILRRLQLLGLAVAFWLVFAAGIALLAASGHAMIARWHLGPIVGTELWRVLVFSPEILVFLFFMITDPKTVPEEARPRRAFGAAIVPAGRAPDRAPDDRVRDQGGRARGAGPRLRRPNVGRDPAVRRSNVAGARARPAEGRGRGTRGRRRALVRGSCRGDGSRSRGRARRGTEPQRRRRAGVRE
jgi:hypothetical protein